MTPIINYSKIVVGVHITNFNHFLFSASQPTDAESDLEIYTMPGLVRNGYMFAYKAVFI